MLFFFNKLCFISSPYIKRRRRKKIKRKRHGMFISFIEFGTFFHQWPALTRKK